MFNMCPSFKVLMAIWKNVYFPYDVVWTLGIWSILLETNDVR